MSPKRKPSLGHASTPAAERHGHATANANAKGGYVNNKQRRSTSAATADNNTSRPGAAPGAHDTHTASAVDEDGHAAAPPRQSAVSHTSSVFSDTEPSLLSHRSAYSADLPSLNQCAPGPAALLGVSASPPGPRNRAKTISPEQAQHSLDASLSTKQSDVPSSLQLLSAPQTTSSASAAASGADGCGINSASQARTGSLLTTKTDPAVAALGHRLSTPSTPLSSGVDEAVFFGGPIVSTATGQLSTTTRELIARNENRYHSLTNSERDTYVPSQTVTSRSTSPTQRSSRGQRSTTSTAEDASGSRCSTSTRKSGAGGSGHGSPTRENRYGSISVSEAMLSLKEIDEEDEEEAAVASLAAIVNDLRCEDSMSVVSAQRGSPLSQQTSHAHGEQESVVTRYLRLGADPRAPSSPVSASSPLKGTAGAADASQRAVEKNRGSEVAHITPPARPSTGAPPPQSQHGHIGARLASSSGLTDCAPPRALEEGALSPESALMINASVIQLPPTPLNATAASITRAEVTSDAGTAASSPRPMRSPQSPLPAAYTRVPSPPSSRMTFLSMHAHASPGTSSSSSSATTSSPSTPRRFIPGGVHTVPVSPAARTSGRAVSPVKGNPCVSPNTGDLPLSLLRVPSPPLAASATGGRGSGEAHNDRRGASEARRASASLPGPLSVGTSACSSVPQSPPFVDQSPSMSHLPPQKQSDIDTAAALAMPSRGWRRPPDDTVHHTISPGQQIQARGWLGVRDADGYDGTEVGGAMMRVRTSADNINLGSFLEKQQSFSITRGAAPPPQAQSPPSRHVRAGEAQSPDSCLAREPKPEQPLPLMAGQPWLELASNSMMPSESPTKAAAGALAVHDTQMASVLSADVDATADMHAAPLQLPLVLISPLSAVEPPPPLQEVLSVPSPGDMSPTTTTTTSRIAVAATESEKEAGEPRRVQPQPPTAVTDTDEAVPVAPTMSLAQPSMSATMNEAGGDGVHGKDSDSLPTLSRSTSVSFIANIEADEDNAVHVPVTDIVVPRTSLLVVRPRSAQAPPGTSPTSSSAATTTTTTTTTAAAGTGDASLGGCAEPTAEVKTQPYLSATETNNGGHPSAISSKHVAREQALAESFRNRIQVGVKPSRARKSVVRRSKSADNNRSGGGGGPGRSADGSGSGSGGGHRSNSSNASRRRGVPAALRRSTPGYNRGDKSGQGGGRGPAVAHTHFVSVAIIGFFLSRMLAVVKRVRRAKYLEEVERPHAAFVIQCTWRAYTQRQRVCRAEAAQLLVPWLRRKLWRLRRAKEASARLLQRVFRGQRDRSFHHFLYQQMQYNRALHTLQRRVGMWEARSLLQRLRDERDERNIVLQQCEQGTVRLLRQQRQEWADIMREAHEVLHVVHNFTVVEWATMVEERTGFNPLINSSDDDDGDVAEENDENNNNSSGSVVDSRERTPTSDSATPPSSCTQNQVNLRATLKSSPSSRPPSDAVCVTEEDAAHVVGHIITATPSPDVCDRCEEVDASSGPSLSIQQNSPRSPPVVTVVPPRDGNGSALCHARKRQRPLHHSSAQPGRAGRELERSSGARHRNSQGSASRSKVILSFAGAQSVVAGLIVSRTRLGQPETAMSFLNETFQFESSRYLDDLFPYATVRHRGRLSSSLINASTNISHSLGNTNASHTNNSFMYNTPLLTRYMSGTPPGGEDGRGRPPLWSSSSEGRLSPVTMQLLESAAQQDKLYCAFVHLLESTEATSRQVLEQTLLEQHRSFLLPISVVNRVLTIHGTVPPLYAPLLLSMKDEEFTSRAAMLFREEQKARLAIIAEYEVVPLASLNRPQLSDEAERRRQRLAYLSRHTAVPLAAYEAEENEFLRKVLKLERRRQLVSGRARSDVEGGVTVSTAAAAGSRTDDTARGRLLSLDADVDDDDDDDDNEQQRSHEPIATLKSAIKPSPSQEQTPSQQSRVQRRFKVVLSSGPLSVATADDTVMMESTPQHRVERHDSILTALTEEVAASERRRPHGAPIPMLRAEPSTVSVRSFSGGTTNLTPLGGIVDAGHLSSLPRPTPTMDAHSALMPFPSSVTRYATNHGNTIASHLHRARQGPPVPRVLLTAEQIDQCEEEGGGNYTLFREPVEATDEVVEATTGSLSRSARFGGTGRPDSGSKLDPIARDAPSLLLNDSRLLTNEKRRCHSAAAPPAGSAPDARRTALPSAPPQRSATAQLHSSSLAAQATNTATPSTLAALLPTTRTPGADTNTSDASPTATAAPSVQPPTLRALRPLGLARRASPFEVVIGSSPPTLAVPDAHSDKIGRVLAQPADTAPAEPFSSTHPGTGRTSSSAGARRNSQVERTSGADEEPHAESEALMHLPVLRAAPPLRRPPLAQSPLAVVSETEATTTMRAAESSHPLRLPSGLVPPRQHRASDASTVVPFPPLPPSLTPAFATSADAGGGRVQNRAHSLMPNQHSSAVNAAPSSMDGDVARSEEDDLFATPFIGARTSVATTAIPQRLTPVYSSTTTHISARGSDRAAIDLDQLSLFDSTSSSSDIRSQMVHAKDTRAVYDARFRAVKAKENPAGARVGGMPPVVVAATMTGIRRPPSPPPRRVHTIGH